MEGQEFVAETIERAPLDIPRLVEKEMTQDYRAYFTDEECALYERRLSGEIILGKQEGILDKARNRWWFEKYGFPYGEKLSRDALLLRKHAPRERNTLARELQERLFRAVEAEDAAEYAQIHDEYVEKFPDQLEGVSALLEFPNHLERHVFLHEHSFQDKDEAVRSEMLKTVEESTQYAFLLTHFLAHNGEDKYFLKNFWDVIERMAEKKGMTKIAHQLRRGILSQVAVFHVFEQLGMNPKLSHPQEDAFKSVDLWVEGAGAVQIKGSDKRKDEMFIETDEIDFPGVQTVGEGGSRHVNSHLFKEFNRFKAKLSRYQDELQKPLKGYFAVVPYHEFDHVTGEPSEEIIRRSADCLGVNYEPATPQG